MEILGERWALLVVRELHTGPRRFTDIRAALPGISANVLTQRLEGLEAAGVVRRTELPPPAASKVYELTEWGAQSGPIFEALGFLTDSRLLELGSLNHPLIREMVVKAPGTYHHSMVVGSLAEQGAEAIQANSLLVRVAAPFHDIGKMLKPQYFIENQRGEENPHDRLTPSMSALVSRCP